MQKWMRRFGLTGLFSHIRLAECYLLQSVVKVPIFVLFLKQINVDLMKINRKECRKLLMWKIFPSCQDNIFLSSFFLWGVTLQGCMLMFCCYSCVEEMRLMKIFCVKTCRRERCPWNMNAAEMFPRHISATRNMNCCEHLPSQICIDGDALTQNRRILISRY